MHYENAAAIEGFSDFKLIFRNDILVVISLEPKKLEANGLPRAYDCQFVYLSDKFSEAISPQDFERNQGKVYPKTFPSLYYVMHKADESYIFAMIGNTSFGSMLSQSLGGRDAGESLPGKVSVIQLVSRKLEETKSCDLLK